MFACSITPTRSKVVRIMNIVIKSAIGTQFESYLHIGMANPGGEVTLHVYIPYVVCMPLFCSVAPPPPFRDSGSAAVYSIFFSTWGINEIADSISKFNTGDTSLNWSLIGFRTSCF